jgi:hypothetical protein
VTSTGQSTALGIQSNFPRTQGDFMKSIEDIAAQIRSQTLELPPLDKVAMSIRVLGETHCLLDALSDATNMPISTLASQLLTPAVEEFKNQYLKMADDPEKALGDLSWRFDANMQALRRRQDNTYKVAP